MKELNVKQIIILGIVAVIFCATVGLYIYKTSFKDNDEYFEGMENLDNFEEEEDKLNEDVSNQILVHVTGAVNSVGVVVLEEGSRIIDAIEACGGEKEEADLNKINLAYILQDGDKLYVPSVNDNDDLEYISTKSGDNVIVNGAGNKSEGNGMININTASKEELMALSGIGDSTAEKIIAYRKENGKFKSIEDIKNVPGIGDSKFNNIKDKITV